MAETIKEILLEYEIVAAMINIGCEHGYICVWGCVYMYIFIYTHIYICLLYTHICGQVGHEISMYACLLSS